MPKLKKAWTTIAISAAAKKQLTLLAMADDCHQYEVITRLILDEMTRREVQRQSVPEQRTLVSNP